MPSIQQIKQLPDNLDRLSQQIEDDPESLLTPITKGFAAPMANDSNDDDGFESLDTEEVAIPVASELPLNQEQRGILSAGGRAVRKVQQEGANAVLTPEEEVGFEAIVILVGRPAIFIQGGKFHAPPESWQILEEKRNDIETALRSVGRIEITGHASLDWVGTGFLVAKDVVMTNRHVAEVFCQMGNRRRWKFKSNMSGRIDYAEEFASINPAEFELRSVIGVHEELDLALFRVRRTSPLGIKPPKPLTIASTAPFIAPGRLVYTCGYPAWDGRRNDPEPMLRIFHNIYNIKRLQPGEVRETRGPIFVHDCSTLGGNSGSAIIDLKTGTVLGLHFGGRYTKGNYAVALWKLTEDPLLQKAKINFV